MRHAVSLEAACNSVIAHVSDMRRPRCRNVLLSGRLAAFSPDECSRLNAKGSEALRVARRQAHAIPVGHAAHPDGKCTGHMQM